MDPNNPEARQTRNTVSHPPTTRNRPPVVPLPNLHGSSRGAGPLTEKPSPERPATQPVGIESNGKSTLREQGQNRPATSDSRRAVPSPSYVASKPWPEPAWPDGKAHSPKAGAPPTKRVLRHRTPPAPTAQPPALPLQRPVVPGAKVTVVTSDPRLSPPRRKARTLVRALSSTRERAGVHGGDNFPQPAFPRSASPSPAVDGEKSPVEQETDAAEAMKRHVDTFMQWIESSAELDVTPPEGGSEGWDIDGATAVPQAKKSRSDLPSAPVSLTHTSTSLGKHPLGWTGSASLQLIDDWIQSADMDHLTTGLAMDAPSQSQALTAQLQPLRFEGPAPAHQSRARPTPPTGAPAPLSNAPAYVPAPLYNPPTRVPAPLYNEPTGVPLYSTATSSVSVGVSPEDLGWEWDPSRPSAQMETLDSRATTPAPQAQAVPSFSWQLESLDLSGLHQLLTQQERQLQRRRGQLPVLAAQAAAPQSAEPQLQPTEFGPPLSVVQPAVQRAGHDQQEHVASLLGKLHAVQPQVSAPPLPETAPASDPDPDLLVSWLLSALERPNGPSKQPEGPALAPQQPGSDSAEEPTIQKDLEVAFRQHQQILRLLEQMETGPSAGDLRPAEAHDGFGWLLDSLDRMEQQAGQRRHLPPMDSMLADLLCPMILADRSPEADARPIRCPADAEAGDVVPESPRTPTDATHTPWFSEGSLPRDEDEVKDATGVSEPQIATVGSLADLQRLETELPPPVEEPATPILAPPPGLLSLLRSQTREREELVRWLRRYCWRQHQEMQCKGTHTQQELLLWLQLHNLCLHLQTARVRGKDQATLLWPPLEEQVLQNSEEGLAKVLREETRKNSRTDSAMQRGSLSRRSSESRKGWMEDIQVERRTS